MEGVLNELALFAGAGGGILGGYLLGWRTVCAIECNPYAASVLMARQNDGCLPPFPIWDDVRTFDGRPWRGRVDVLSGGFPCQDISSAGKGAGITGERSGLWAEMARIIREVGPRFVFVENSPLLTGRGLGVVLGDLASMGYDAQWGVLGAVDAAAPHKRERIWIVGTLADAHQVRFAQRGEHERPCSLARETTDSGREGSKSAVSVAHRCSDVAHAPGLLGDDRDDHAGVGVGSEALAELGDGPRPPDVANPDGSRRQGLRLVPLASGAQQPDPPRCGWWEAEPDVGRVADGVANRVDRLAALGNGQVSAVARLAWRRLGGP